MSKDSSFDIVSVVDLQEVDNAVNQARKEAITRYDLKATGTEIDFDRNEGRITVTTANEMALRSVIDMIQSKLVRRGIDVKALQTGTVAPASQGRVRQECRIIQGIEAEIARQMSKHIRDAKLKLTVQIEGDKLRVSSKSKDVLQEAIGLVKNRDYGIPIQFVNFR